METLIPEASVVVQKAIANNHLRPGALLPILHEVQEQLRYIPAAAVPAIAKALNLSRAEVHGVITFYHHFRPEMPGRHSVQICRAEACQASGAEALAAHAHNVTGCQWHETTADDMLTLEPAYCLGHCAAGPAIMIDDTPHARVSPAQFDQLIAALQEAS